MRGVARRVGIRRLGDGEMLSSAEIFGKEIIPSLDKKLKSRKKTFRRFK